MSQTPRSFNGNEVHEDLISVVIPAFNAQRTIEDTLRSILAQEEVNLELLVVDDCSTDQTAVVVQRLSDADTRVRPMRTNSNSGGPATPRNLGIQYARGSWVALCDADDLWHPEKLRRQLEVAKLSGADLVCSGILNFEDGQTPIPLPKVTERQAASYSRLSHMQLLIKNRVATSSVMCRTTVFKQLKQPFDPARELIAVEDYDLWLRLTANPRFHIIKHQATLVHYRKVATSLSSGKAKYMWKVMHVVRKTLIRDGYASYAPFLLPLLFLTYGVLSVYWRVIRGRL